MFTKVIKILESKGFRELCPSERYWTFHKGLFLVKLDWYTGRVYAEKF